MDVCVTGGGGFLGRAVVRQLLQRGYTVRSFARGDYPSLRALGVQVIRGDLANFDDVKQAFTGCDAVIHVAAKAGMWGPYQEYYRANVIGTENVIKACQALGIRNLVYTSSPSVVHAGQDLDGVDESTPYPKHFLAAYPKTKAIAEQRVVAASKEGLQTVSLRPHLIWGPGDQNLLPRLLARAEQHRLRLIDGCKALVDTVYVDNAAEAHLLALDKLQQEPSSVNGKVYFITQGDPLPLSNWINRLLAACGGPKVTQSVPRGLAYFAATAIELFAKAIRMKSEPPLTRFLVEQLATAHWFDISAARQDLNYVPRISTEEGFKRLADAWDKTYA